MPSYTVRLVGEPPGGHVTLEITPPNGQTRTLTYLAADLLEPFDPDENLGDFVAYLVRIYASGKTLADLRACLAPGETLTIGRV
jgi:hypothetical protein